MDDPDPESTDQGDESEKQKPKIVNNICTKETEKPVQPSADKQPEDEAMASIEEFLKNYEEDNVDQSRMQKWASAQQKRARPVFFKTFVEGLNQQGP